MQDALNSKVKPRNILIVLEGKALPIKNWQEELGISPVTFYRYKKRHDLTDTEALMLCVNASYKDKIYEGVVCR